MPGRRLTRDEQQARTRAAVLDAAEAMFRRHGFHATSVEAVAEAAGFSKGAVYSNFAGKDDLFLALLARRTERGLAAAAEVAGAGATDPPIEALAGMLASYAREERDWTLLVAEFWIHALRRPKLRARLAASRREERDGIARLVAGLQRDGAISTSRPAAEVATLVMALTEGLTTQRLADPAAVGDDLYLSALRDLLGAARPPARRRATARSAAG